MKVFLMITIITYSSSFYVSNMINNYKRNRIIHMNNLYENYNYKQRNNNFINEENNLIPIQGESLKTWSYRSPDVKRIQVTLSSNGRPVDGDIELWNGPDNTPFKMRVYIENGYDRPFNTILETLNNPNTVSIKNIGQIEFPIEASCSIQNIVLPKKECLTSSKIIQGGALRIYPFDSRIDSVQVYLKTDGRPLNARIELLQGPNNNKQVIELYSEDGNTRPYFGLIATPGSGNVIRIVNTSPIEFPLVAGVVPHSINNDVDISPVVNF